MICKGKSAVNYLNRYKYKLALLLFISLFRLQSQQISYDSFHNSHFGRRVLAFDTESEVIIYISEGGSPLANAAFKVYDGNNHYLTSGKCDGDGLFSLPNRAYRELGIRVEGSSALHRVELHGIERQEYHLFAIYSKGEDGLIRVAGVLKRAAAAKEPKEFGLDIYDNEGRLMGGRKLNLKRNGYFETELNSLAISGESCDLTFRADGRRLKSYRLYLKEQEFTPFGDPEQGLLLKPERRVLFNEKTLKVELKAEAEQIESLIYTIEDENGFRQEYFYEEELGQELTINLPDHRGPPVERFNIKVELIYRDLNSRAESFSVSRINSLDRELLVEETIESGSNYLNIASPFKEGQALIISYNGKRVNKGLLNLKRGDNRIKGGLKGAPLSNCLVVIRDRQSSRSLSYHFTIINSELQRGGISLNEESYRIGEPKEEGEPLFIYSLPAGKRGLKSLFYNLNDFADFKSIEAQAEPLSPGKTSFSRTGPLLQSVPPELAPTLHLSYYSSGSYYSLKRNLRKEPGLTTAYLIPKKLYPGDSPLVKAIISNQKGESRKLKCTIYSEGRERESRSFSLEPYATAELLLRSGKIGEKKKQELTIIISEGDRIKALHREQVPIKAKAQLQLYTQLTGRVAHNRTTSLFIEVPPNVASPYRIDLHISTRAVETALYKNSITDNIEGDSFETALLNYLKEKLRLSLKGNSNSAHLLSPYYIEGQGIRARRADLHISPDSTLLFLYAMSRDGSLMKGLSQPLLTNLLRNHRAELLSSPLRIFFLAELGIYLKEIDRSYLKRLEANRIFYYRYFKKDGENLTLTDKLSDIYYNGYLLDEEIGKLIKERAGLAKGSVAPKNYSNRLIEDIISTAAILNESTRAKKARALPGESETLFRFKSSILGDFKTALPGNSLISKSYTFLPTAQAEDKRKAVDLSLEKSGPGEFYYLVENRYAIEDNLASENGLLQLSSYWSDSRGEELNSRALTLSEGKTYYFNLVINSKEELKNLLIKPVRCSGLQIDYTNIRLNRKAAPLLFAERLYLTISSLQRGKNILTIPIKARYPGSYIFSGCKIRDIYNFDNFLKTGETRLTVK